MARPRDPMMSRRETQECILGLLVFAFLVVLGWAMLQ